MVKFVRQILCLVANLAEMIVRGEKSLHASKLRFETTTDRPTDRPTDQV